MEKERASRLAPWLRTAASSLAFLRSLPQPAAIDESEAGPLRGAQIAVLMRYTPAVLAANLLNGVVLVAALSFRPPTAAPYLWLALLALYVLLVGWRRYRRRSRSLPTRASRALILKAIGYAGALGAIWGAAPVLFFDSARGDHLVVACVSIGMMCGGALVLAAVPAAALAFTLPIAAGCLFGLIRGARDPIEYFVVFLVFSYTAILLRAALAHGRQFAERVVAQARAEAAALHDPLTGLPNRSALEAALRTVFDRLRRYGEGFSLFCLDLDSFKGINDRLGHQAGDQLLRQVAGRLACAVRAGETIARVGGDEFVMIVRGGDAQRRAHELAKCFDAPFILDAATVLCRGSIGIAQAPADGAEPATLLGCADSALYKAKRESGRAAHFYNYREDNRVRAQREIAHDLIGAAKRGEFFLEYQPIQHLATGRVEACEALARWRHSRFGVLSPARFIRVAEDTGAIHEIGEWILREACAEAKRWPDHISVAVNVSVRQICNSSITRVVERALDDAGLAPNRLQIEITESAPLIESDKLRALTRLSEAGVSIVLDDFGTGYSAFDHVCRLPIHGLKIERAFIAALPFNRKTGAIVQAVSHLAEALDLRLVAEGIESELQLEFLRHARFELGQGYLFAPPQSSDALLESLDATAPLRKDVA
jgi:diguanylate cyclase